MLLPIVHRELGSAARRRETYRQRFWLAAAMVGMWLCLLRFGQSSLPVWQQGQSLFRASGILAMAFAMLAGAFLTADCLSREKREGTLGLLFLTELKGYDVVLGKLVATSLHGFYGLLAVFPVLGLPLLLGSVTLGEFARIALALVATLFLSLSIGMLISALWMESRQTMTLTLVAVLLLAGIPPVLGLLASSWASPGAPRLLFAPSPAGLFFYGLEANYSGGFPSRASMYWTSLLTILTVAGSALIFPCFYVPRAWREAGQESKAASGGFWQRLRLGSSAQRLLGRRRLNVNPFYWLAGRDLTPRWIAWALLVPMFCAWAGFMLASLPPTPNQETYVTVSMLTAYFMHQVLKYLVAVEATRRLSEARRSGTLEPLLVTPIAESEIMAGQRRALILLFAGPAVLLLATNLAHAWIPVLSGLAAGRFYRDAPLFFVAGLGGAAVLFYDLHALSLVGMWLAVRDSGHRRAVFGTLARVMLGPWLVVACLVLIRGLGRTVAFESIICWLGVSALLDLSLANWARDELTKGLRDHPPPSAAPGTRPAPALAPGALTLP
jgi:ABC-type transport system involved in multi-copper enzyme maturation permease subunit